MQPHFSRYPPRPAVWKRTGYPRYFNPANTRRRPKTDVSRVNPTRVSVPTPISSTLPAVGSMWFKYDTGDLIPATALAQTYYNHTFRDSVYDPDTATGGESMQGWAFANGLYSYYRPEYWVVEASFVPTQTAPANPRWLMGVSFSANGVAPMSYEDVKSVSTCRYVEIPFGSDRTSKPLTVKASCAIASLMNYTEVGGIHYNSNLWSAFNATPSTQVHCHIFFVQLKMPGMVTDPQVDWNSAWGQYRVRIWLKCRLHGRKRDVQGESVMQTFEF